MKFYTGIGSRETPLKIQEHMTTIADRLNQLGYWLRSGGAPGADSAFEAGAGDKKHIYLPWRFFNDNQSSLYHVSEEAKLLASRFHPAWGACKPAARLLHGRNGYQVLGEDLVTPSDFVLCWTPGGSGSGGTGQALRIAKHFNVPIFDLGSEPKEKLKVLANLLEAKQSLEKIHGLA